MVCLDSSVIIDLIRGKIDLEIIESRFDSNEEEIFIPSPAIVELVRGVYLKGSLKNIKENEIEVIKELISSFVVLDLDKESAIKAGEIEAELVNKGEIIDLEDIMIGAIALNNDETVFTKNRKHFDKIRNLKVESY